MRGQSHPVNYRSSKSFNALGRCQSRELHPHSLRGSQRDRTTCRRYFEQCHQACRRSGLARRSDNTDAQGGLPMRRSIRPKHVSTPRRHHRRRARAMVRNGPTSGPALVPGPDMDSDRRRSSARADHHRCRRERGERRSLAASPFPSSFRCHDQTSRPGSGALASLPAVAQDAQRR